MDALRTPRESGRDSATELLVDYKDISSGRLVIVIRGFPTTAADSFTPAPARLRIAPAPEPDHEDRSGSPSSPLLDEAEAINDVIGYAPVLVTTLVLAAWRGQEARALGLIAATIEAATTEDECRATALAEYAGAVLYNGLGRYQDARAAAERACLHRDLGSSPWALIELVEAAVRSDARDIAAEALIRLDELMGAGARMPGVRARSAALLADGDQAEALHREAIELLGHSRTAQLARAQLVYGEWLRREGRRVDARQQLRAAHETFRQIGADAFAARSLRELLATGETVRRRADDARAGLTPQEAHIARLARDGLTNPEIGAQLFLSPRTVQYHLRKVFRKLEISSRNHLGRVPLNLLAA
jgi:DNA-binding CsgD family transcriptional regulator